MPRVAVWLLRAALLCLALGFTAGALMLASKGIPWGGDLNTYLRPAHRELLLVGWTIQLVMGVAFWIFPRQRLGSLPYGREWLGWLAVGLLNGGVLLIVIGSLMSASHATFQILGRFAELSAATALSVNLWGRVRPFGLSQI